MIRCGCGQPATVRCGNCNAAVCSKAAAMDPERCRSCGQRWGQDSAPTSTGPKGKRSEDIGVDGGGERVSASLPAANIPGRAAGAVPPLQPLGLGEVQAVRPASIYEGWAGL